LPLDFLTFLVLFISTRLFIYMQKAQPSENVSRDCRIISASCSRGREGERQEASRQAEYHKRKISAGQPGEVHDPVGLQTGGRPQEERQSLSDEVKSQEVSRQEEKHRRKVQQVLQEKSPRSIQTRGET
jgi:hypothetical protein